MVAAKTPEKIEMGRSLIHIKKYIVVLPVIWASQISCAQVQNIGEVISYKKNKSGIEGKTPAAIFDVQAWSDNIIRVRVSKDSAFNNFSYALTGSRHPGHTVTFRENGNSIFLLTGSIEAEIEKRPSFRVIFRNRKGTIINEDAAGKSFGTAFTGDKVSVYKKMQEAERFVAMGEALGDLDKRGTGVSLNNTDNYKYGDPRLSMYISIPFYIGIHHEQLYGLFYNNTHKAFFNFGLSTPDFTSVNFEGGDSDYFFMYDNSVAKILEHYTSLTGRTQLPALWSLGYHQSRCSYYPQEKVKWIGETFRKKNIPLDCIVLDADYQHEYEPFRVNLERFPNMATLAAELASMNIELTASVYPGVKIDTTYQSYTEGIREDLFIKFSDGSPFKTEIAPVKCHLLDYTNPRVRTWWKNKMKWLPDNGIHGYWNDMNEPAVAGSYLPDNLLFDFDGHKANAPGAKNVYGFQMARSSYEAALQNSPGRRPFILTRSGFAGVQRYSAVWSGDNTASDEGLLSSVLLNNQMGLSGISFCGYDIGGFIGDGTRELFTRWMQAGVFSPFCRNHKGCGGIDSEPWSYGSETEEISKVFIGFRYRLMPYIYAAFYASSQTGLPVAKSLCINYPFESRVYDKLYQYQFLFGKELLVVPVTGSEKTKKIFLPQGEWFNIYTDEKINGSVEWTEDVPIYQLPVFAKASAIIPMQTIVQSAKDKPGDTLYLHVYNGKEKNIFTYYEDAGDGFGYLDNQFCKRNIEFAPAEKKIVVHRQEGTFASRYKKIKLVLHGFDEGIKKLYAGRHFYQLKETNNKLLNIIDFFPDEYDIKTEKVVLKPGEFVIDNQSGEILIRW